MYFFDLTYVVLWRVFHHEIRHYDVKRCSNVFYHLKYKVLICEPKIEFNNLAGGKALATDHRVVSYHMTDIFTAESKLESFKMINFPTEVNNVTWKMHNLFSVHGILLKRILHREIWSLPVPHSEMLNWVRISTIILTCWQRCELRRKEETEIKRCYLWRYN